MDNRFDVGSRVRVSTEYHWAKGVLGTVKLPPREVQMLARDWEGCSRTVKMVKGPQVFYWVAFDAPQDDGSGDGPYAEAEIDSSYLSPV
jgi:hypothetical protein